MSPTESKRQDASADSWTAARAAIEAAAAAIFAIGKRQGFVELAGFADADAFKRHIAARDFVVENGPVSATIGDFCIGYRKYAGPLERPALDSAQALIDAVSLRTL